MKKKKPVKKKAAPAPKAKPARRNVDTVDSEENEIDDLDAEPNIAEEVDEVGLDVSKDDSDF